MGCSTWLLCTGVAGPAAVGAPPLPPPEEEMLSWDGTLKAVEGAESAPLLRGGGVLPLRSVEVRPPSGNCVTQEINLPLQVA